MRCDAIGWAWTHWARCTRVWSHPGLSHVAANGKVWDDVKSGRVPVPPAQGTLFGEAA